MFFVRSSRFYGQKHFHADFSMYTVETSNVTTLSTYSISEFSVTQGVLHITDHYRSYHSSLDVVNVKRSILTGFDFLRKNRKSV